MALSTKSPGRSFVKETSTLSPKSQRSPLNIRPSTVLIPTATPYNLSTRRSSTALLLFKRELSAKNPDRDLTHRFPYSAKVGEQAPPLHGQWKFTGSRGALCLIYGSQIVRLSDEMQEELKSTVWGHGKYLVTYIQRCSAYAFYLSDKSEQSILTCSELNPLTSNPQPAKLFLLA